MKQTLLILLSLMVLTLSACDTVEPPAPSVTSTSDSVVESVKPVKVVLEAAIVGASTYPPLTSTKPPIMPTAEEIKEIQEILNSFTIDKLEKILVSDMNTHQGTYLPLTSEEVANYLTMIQSLNLVAGDDMESTNPSTGEGSSIYLEQGDMTIYLDRTGHFTINIPSLDKNYILSYLEVDSFSAPIASKLFLDTVENNHLPLKEIPESTGHPKDIIPTLDTAFATEKELTEYQNFIKSLDCTKITSMVVGDIMRGAPTYEGEGETLDAMTMDKALINLRNTIDVEIFPEPVNPATGGGRYFVNLGYDGTEFAISDEGYWLIAKLPQWEQGYIFDASMLQRDEIHPVIPEPEYIEPKPNTDAKYTTDKRYADAKVTSAQLNDETVWLYALDTIAGLTAPLPADIQSKMLPHLEKLADSATQKTAQYAIVVETNDGKEYIYLEDETLIAQCKDVIENSPTNLHWFTHMTTNKIKEITYRGHNRAFNQSIELTLTEAEAISNVSYFLKNKIYATSSAEISEYQSNPNATADGFFLNIVFHTGVTYRCLGNMNGISIYSNDLEKSMSYSITEESILALRDHMDAQQG